MEREPLDVWLKMSDDPEEELAEYEANTFAMDGRFVVEWYHNAVGQVRSRWFDTYEEATDWLASEGFEDYSS